MCGLQIKQIQNIKAFTAKWEVSSVEASHGEAPVPLCCYFFLRFWGPFGQVPLTYLPCPKQPLYQNYPPEENQFVYRWRVLHIRHFKPRLACSFTEKTSAGPKRVEEVDRCQRAKEQFKKRWPEQTSADRKHKCHNKQTFKFCIFRRYNILGGGRQVSVQS